MPPKATQKAKAAATSTPKAKVKPNAKVPDTPASRSSSPSSIETTPEQEKKTAQATHSAKKKKKEPTTLQNVPRSSQIPLQVDVKFEGDSPQAQAIKDGLYSQTLKLNASDPFTVVKMVKFTSGEFEGYEAILLQPAKPFPFLKIPKEVRTRIYKYYFAPNRVVNQVITLEGKRTNKDVFAKMYSEGSKYRVGLLTANQEILEEARPVLYDHALRIDSTTTIMDFFGQLPSGTRQHITKLSVKTWIKTNARNAMHFMAESGNITSLYIETGVHNGSSPVKAAKEFYDWAYKFLETIDARRGKHGSSVDILSFGKNAFTYKEDSNKVKKPWAPEQVQEFKDALREKLEA